jgi:hypothetical protein
VLASLTLLFAQAPSGTAGGPDLQNLTPEKAAAMPKSPLLANQLPETWQTVRVGSQPVTVRVVGDPASSIRYVALHGNEETAPQAALAHLQRYPGCLVQLVNPGQRLIRFRFRGRPYDFDPNRIFSRGGIEQNLKFLNRRLPKLARRYQRQIADQVEAFSRELERLLLAPQVSGLIAVHNNGTTPRSRFSLESYIDSDGYFQGVEALHYRRNHSPYSLILVTDAGAFEELTRLDLNVVLEDGNLAKEDGSLSVYCARQHIRYANVETRLGELDKQIEMLNTVREIWHSAPQAPPNLNNPIPTSSSSP